MNRDVGYCAANVNIVNRWIVKGVYQYIPPFGERLAPESHAARQRDMNIAGSAENSLVVC